MAVAPPRTLSPTKVSSFTSCPLAFRLTNIDRIPEPPTPHLVKGTLVHSALERLFWEHPAGARTPAAGQASLEAAWRDLQEDPEFVALGLSDADAATFLDESRTLVRNNFTMEDPDRVREVGVELGLQVELGGARLRGIIDRLDLDEHGELVVIDYKTGRSPSPRYEQARMTGVHLYALMCQQVLGRLPVAVRLLYLRDAVTITAVPTEQTSRGQRVRTTAVWSAIERACANEDFRPKPSPLCRFCNFQTLCPAFGGEPPALIAS
jgi:putative RecB family exonuclease